MARIACIALALTCLFGCAAVGPASISNGRAVYADVIARTSQEQTLSNIVRARYLEPGAMLTVASVTANVKLAASAGAEFGIGPTQNFDGNLVPLSAGVAYEENPTISYIPVQGERYVRQFLSPVSVETVVLLARGINTTFAFEVFVERMNDLANLPVAAADTRGDVTPFRRAVEIIATLDDTHHADWAVTRQEDGRATFQIVIFDYLEQHAEHARELCELLDLPEGVGHGEDIILPVRVAVGSFHGRAINLVTRSVYEVMLFAAAAVEVPEEHRDIAQGAELAGVTVPRGFLHIHSSKEPPRNAAIAVPYRGWWFYIDETDGVSKRNFSIVETLMNMQMSESQVQTAPVLTIPVG